MKQRTQFLSILLGFFDNQGYAKQVRVQVGKQLDTAARLKVNQLVRFRRDRLGDAAFFQDNGAFFALVDRLFSVPRDEANATDLREWLAGFQRMSRYDRITLVDSAKNIRVSVPDSAEPIAGALSRSMDAVLRSPRVEIVDFYRNEATGRVHLATLVPVFDGEDRSRAVGILVLRIDPRTYLFPFLDQWPTPSGSAETLLVRREDGEAVTLNDPRFDPDAALTERLLRVKELQERNEESARFTYTVSHDLRSPVVTVKTFLGYLEEDAARGDEDLKRQDTACIRTAVDGMTLLLDGLLEFSRLGHRIEPASEAPLRAIVEEALGLTAGRIAAGRPGRPLEGTGMGLALVKRIVESHGGRVWVQSGGTGLGTVFRFTLAGIRIGDGKEGDQ